MFILWTFSWISGVVTDAGPQRVARIYRCDYNLMSFNDAYGWTRGIKFIISTRLRTPPTITEPSVQIFLAGIRHWLFCATGKNPNKVALFGAAMRSLAHLYARVYMLLCCFYANVCSTCRHSFASSLDRAGIKKKFFRFSCVHFANINLPTKPRFIITEKKRKRENSFSHKITEWGNG